MTVWQPKTGEQVTDIVISALAERRKLSVSGHETKAGLGHPVDAKESLSLKNLSGIVDYQPEELVLRVIFCLALQRYLEGEMCLNLAAV